MPAQTAALLAPRPFEIVDADGSRHATNGETAVALLETDGRMFRRRAVKAFGTPEARSIEWLVVELAGVRVYVDGKNVIVTREDLNP
jgi:hypothetical protein